MHHTQDTIDRINWFHSFDQETFGFSTAGKKGIQNKEEAKAWGFGPGLFAGKSVLDIGAWDGYYSFLAEKHQASSVLATDHFSWGGPGWGTKAGFDLAHQQLDSRVQSREIDALDISPETVGMFDVVLFLGVLYHLPNPLLGLQAAASVTRELLVVETTFEHKLDPKKALFELRPPRLNADTTSYWSPNIKGISDALIDLMGFKRVVAKAWMKTRVICFAYR